MTFSASSAYQLTAFRIAFFSVADSLILRAFSALFTRSTKAL
jgi:hypothetical protein